MSIQKLFGSSGIRGDATEFFTNQRSFDLGRVFAIFLTRHQATGSIVVGMDPRESSPRIKSAFIKGLLYENRNVFDNDVTPIPSINWILLSNKSFAGGVMVSGSHVKPHLNGLKFFAFGEEILKEHEEEIQNIYNLEMDKVNFESVDDQKLGHPIEDNTARTSYIEYLISKAKTPFPRIKIVIDAGNGAQSEVAPELLNRLGFEVVELNTNIQNEFMSRDTEVSGDFEELQKKVVEVKADLGIGYDSDGDRVVFIDEMGNFIPGDYSGSLISMSIDTAKIVTPINTSAVAEKTGKEVIRTRVGSPFVLGKMKETGAKFGFEANGGGIFFEMHSRDGGRSTIEFLNLLSSKKMKASELVATLPKYYILRDKVEYEWELKDKILNKAKEDFKGEKIEELDGLKIWINSDTWILFRSSANAPEFRVFVESLSKDLSEKLLNDGMNLVKTIVDNG